MSPPVEFHYDVTAALTQGRRAHQEDAVAADFQMGAGMGFVVLADGMGGHAAGDVASKIAVTEVFSELKMRSGDPEWLKENVPAVLHEAVLSANECVRFHASENPETAGMGTTLLAPVLLADSLYWVSVGDSPLYLFRKGRLIRLNEDHSMVPQIDYMVKTGVIDTETGRTHPDRNCLTSVLIGGEIAQIDCPIRPVRLECDDVLIAASDGLQFLSESEIAGFLTRKAGRGSAEISAGLLGLVQALDDPDQDNVSLCVVRVTDDPCLGAAAPAPAAQAARDRRPEGVAFIAKSTKSRRVVSYKVSMEKSA